MRATKIFLDVYMCTYDCMSELSLSLRLIHNYVLLTFLTFYIECRTGLDLIFVLDSSGSVGPANFQIMLTFVTNVVSNLNIGSDQVRVGVIQYSTKASVRFSLNSYMTNASLLEAIANIKYAGSGTYTNAAILTCIEQFNTSYGARPKSNGIPRIAIVITDGYSTNSAATVAAAEIAHSEGIISYAVGVGDNVNMEELAIIATDPDTQYVRSVAEFSSNEFRILQESLNNEACRGKPITKSILHVHNF